MKIENYGFIGDMHTAALVSTDGSIDWLCLPRFDSNACFAALLGEEKNGCWKIAPSDRIERASQVYRGDTLVLETVFETESGKMRVVDCMPPYGKSREVVRLVEGIEGEVNVEMKLIVRFDYGRTVPWVRHGFGGTLAIAGPDALILRTNVETKGEGLSTVARFPIRPGERKFFVLTYHLSHDNPPEPIDAFRAVENTELYWRAWAARCTYHGEWRDAVMRSLLTLKALTFAPTGGIVAAATTSLPEQLGGVRNWDYRYCWLRDATFTLFSFMEAGYTEEAAAWSDWLLRAVAGDPAQLQIMYGAAGERMLTEIKLPHLRGYEDSRPVRIGNAAAEQFQLDVYGEVMDAMHLARAVGIPTGADSWRLQRHLVDFVEKNWRQPDEGIWEIRGPRRHFTHSKVMAWVTIDRAVKAVEEFRLEGDVERWRALRQEIHDDVCRQGFNEQQGAFTQFYGSEDLDASLLMIPLVGFLPATDPRVVGTINAIQRDLISDGLVMRYRTRSSGEIDGLPAGEGTFLPCSFWLVDCLYLLGRVTEARDLYTRLLAVRTPLGLLAEEYDTEHGRLIGNFPQAFTHVGLINTAQNLAEGIAGPADVRSTNFAPGGEPVRNSAVPFALP